MAKARDPLTKMREICFSLPGVQETTHFGQPAFRVGKKMFATCSNKDGSFRIQLQLQPQHAKSLLDSDPRFEPYRRIKNVVSMQADAVKNWNEVRALVLESYEIIAAGKKSVRKRTSSQRPKK